MIQRIFIRVAIVRKKAKKISKAHSHPLGVCFSYAVQEFPIDVHGDPRIAHRRIALCHGQSVDKTVVAIPIGMQSLGRVYERRHGFDGRVDGHVVEIGFAPGLDRVLDGRELAVDAERFAALACRNSGRR